MNPLYAMERINTWWKSGEVDPVFLHKRIRSEFSAVLAGLEGPVTDVQGPCGSGRTALLYQTVHHLLSRQVPPRRILLLDGGEMTLFGEQRSIGALLDVYATDILHENLFALSSPVYVMIDEVDLVEEWRVYLLNYAHRAPLIRFVVTHGLGCRGEQFPEETERCVRLMPLTQTQFAEFWGVYKNTDLDLVRFKSLLPGLPLLEDPPAYYEALAANTYPLEEFRPYKSKIIEDYLLCGGYPGYFGAPGRSTAEWFRSLLELLDRSIYLDVAPACNIRAPFKLKKLLYFIASRGGAEQSYGSIGRPLYLDTSTAIAYTAALGVCGFSGTAENYSSSLEQKESGHVVRKNRRFFMLDPGLTNAFLHQAEISSRYDALVLQACRYMAHEHALAAGGDIFFWKDGRREVDLVVRTPYGLLPVSVNCRREISETRIRSLRAFLRIFGAKYALLVTKDRLGVSDGIYFIPYWMI